MPNRFGQPAVKLPKLSACSMPHGRLTVALDHSQIGAAAFAEILKGFVRKIVEPPFASVLLELPIPRLGIEPIEPLTKRRQIGPRKPSHCIFDFADRGHVNLAPK
jgi:hypothetical protein